MFRRINLVLSSVAIAVCLVVAGAVPAVAQNEQEIPIGSLLAMTGSGAFYGKVMSRGMELAIAQVNGSDALEGYKLVLHIEDHQSGNTGAATSGMRKLINIDNTPIIISSYGGVTLAVQPLAARRNVLLLNGGGTASTLINKDNLYNTRMVAGQIAPLAVKWAVEKLGAKKVATLYYTSSSGTETNEAVKAACKEMGCEVVHEEPYKLGSTDFSVALSRIEASSPDVIILGSWGADVGHIVKQAKERGITANIVGLELLRNELKIAGKQMNGYTAVFDHFNPNADNSATRSFVDAYKKEYTVVPGYYAANYYEAIKDVITPLIQQTIKAGEDPTKIGVLNTEMKKLVKQGFKFSSVYGGVLKLHKDGSVSKPVAVVQVQHGKAIPIATVRNGEFVESGE